MQKTTFQAHRTLAFTLLLFLAFTQGCDTAPQPLTPEETSAITDTLNAWVTIFNEDKFKEYGTYQADTCDLFGEPVAKDHRKVRQQWFKARSNSTDVKFKFDPTRLSIDSVGKNLVRATMPMVATHSYKKGLEEETPVEIYIRRIPPYRIYQVQADLVSLGNLIDAEGLEKTIKDGFYTSENEVNFELLRHIVDNIGGEFDDFAFATRAGGKDLLYVVDKQFGSVGWDYAKWSPKGKMGLADFRGNLLLPVQYDLIYTFDALAPGHAEIEKDGKFGLVNTEGKVMLPAEYDVLLPASSDKYLAIVRKGSAYGTVDKQGNVKMGSAAPTALDIVSQYDFSKKLDAVTDKYKGPEMVPLSKKDGPRYQSYAIPPALFQQMGIANVLMPMNAYDPGANQGLTIDRKFDLSEKIKGFISVLETYTFEPRDEYHDKVYALNTYDESLNPIAQQELMKTGGDVTFGHYCDIAEIKLLGEDTLEAKFSTHLKKDSPYEEDVQYNYFQLTPDGEVKQLESDRAYPFTKFTVIDASYLEGCFCQEIPEAEWNPEKRKQSEQYYNEYWVTAHYTANEITTMIREIEEDYSEGEDKSPIDAANHAFLTQYLEKVKADEAAFLKKEHKEVIW